jgi:hypothetical protein
MIFSPFLRKKATPVNSLLIGKKSDSDKKSSGPKKSSDFKKVPVSKKKVPVILPPPLPFFLMMVPGTIFLRASW